MKLEQVGDLLQHVVDSGVVHGVYYTPRRSNLHAGWVGRAQCARETLGRSRWSRFGVAGNLKEATLKGCDANTARR